MTSHVSKTKAKTASKKSTVEYHTFDDQKLQNGGKLYNFQKTADRKQ